MQTAGLRLSSEEMWVDGSHTRQFQDSRTVQELLRAEIEAIRSGDDTPDR